MKYVDVDKLKAEIERLEVLYDEALKNPSFASYESSLIAKGKHRQREDLLSFINSLQQEQPEEICSKCVYHKKDNGYCYNPNGGMKRRINENGVYECTAFLEREQEEPKQKQ